MAYIIVKTTFANKKDAEEVAGVIINKKLAACIQLSEVDSYYRWNNKIEKAHEYKLDIKTLSKKYNEIEQVILKNHKYKIPEIIAHKIKKGSKDYLNWVKKEIH